MDEATATGSRVDFARICVEIDTAFSFPRTTHQEVDAIQEDIRVDYDWEPHPCAVCSSFGHEEGSCSTMVSTLATMEAAVPTTVNLVQGEAVATPGVRPLPLPLLQSHRWRSRCLPQTQLTLLRRLGLW